MIELNKKPSCKFRIVKGIKNIPALPGGVEYGSIRVDISGVSDEQISQIVEFVEVMCR